MKFRPLRRIRAWVLHRAIPLLCRDDLSVAANCYLSTGSHILIPRDGFIFKCHIGPPPARHQNHAVLLPAESDDWFGGKTDDR